MSSIMHGYIGFEIVGLLYGIIKVNSLLVMWDLCLLKSLLSSKECKGLITLSLTNGCSEL